MRGGAHPPRQPEGTHAKRGGMTGVWATPLPGPSTRSGREGAPGVFPPLQFSRSLPNFQISLFFFFFTQYSAQISSANSVSGFQQAGRRAVHGKRILVNPCVAALL